MNRPETQQWRFGFFLLDGAQHLLFRNGGIAPLSRKAVDILVVLLESHGQLVEKEELMRRVWPDSFVEESNLAVHISQLRKVLSEEANSSRIETIPRRGYRFVGEIERRPKQAAVPASEPGLIFSEEPLKAELLPGIIPAVPGQKPGPRNRWVILGATAVVLLVIAAIGLYRYVPKRMSPAEALPPATPRPADSVVLADFSNNTGDPVFNNTLRQAMAIELEQSPFLRLVPESRMQQTLRLMGKPDGAPLTAEIARELCQRNGSEAVLDGWIAKLGTEYAMGVRAVNCRSGDHIADLQATASGKEQVLKALGDVTGQLRAKLGESLSTVQRFDTPIEEATTPSLEALQAYSLGKATMVRNDDSAACVPFFQRAIRLDPDFAIAYAALGNAYSNLGEAGLAAANIRRAYELRQRVSEREQLYIESHYHTYVTGDLAKATVIYETWTATYPDDSVPQTDLNLIDADLGKFGPMLDAAKAALRIAPDDSQNYANLANAYLLLGRLDEARATIEQAMSRKFDSSDLHLYLYDLAFLKQDAAGMEKQLNWAAGEPGVEDLFLGHAADAKAFAGQDAQARELTARAVESERRSNQRETAAGYEVSAAQREALLGNIAEAARRAQAALALAQDRDTKYGAAVALALAGETKQSGRIADELSRDFPDDTIAQFIYLPTLRGAMALARKDPAAAIRALNAAAPYEIGASGGLLPIYVRGLSYLALNDGPHAQAEFEKILSHPAVVIGSPLAPLAQLQLFRAYTLQGDSMKAKSAYDDVMASWKNADADLPTLQTAKAEWSSHAAVAKR